MKAIAIGVVFAALTWYLAETQSVTYALATVAFAVGVGWVNLERENKNLWSAFQNLRKRFDL